MCVAHILQMHLYNPMRAVCCKISERLEEFERGSERRWLCVVSLFVECPHSVKTL